MPGRAKPFFFLLVIGMGVACADQVGPAPGPELSVTLINSISGLPFTQSYDIAAFPDGQVCVVASYETRVECGHRWPPSTMIGRKGEGPGEFGTVGGILRFGVDSVAIIDMEVGRLSLFEVASGELIYETTLPNALLLPIGISAGRAVVQLLRFWPPQDTVALTAWIDPAADAVERRAFGGLADTTFIRGSLDSDTTLVFQRDEYQFQRFRLSDGALLEDFTSPHYVAETPSEAEVEDQVAGLRQLFRSEPPEADVERIRTEPQNPVVRGSHLRRGPAGTLWVATTQGTGENTVLEVFGAGREPLRIEVRHRVRAFDIIGSTLATLVLRPEEAVPGVPDIGVDWYEIDLGGDF